MSEKEEDRVETNRRIDKELFDNFALQQDITTDVLTRISHSFIWDDVRSNVQVFVVESYLSPNTNFSILRINSEKKTEEVDFPQNFKLFEIIKEVTGNIIRKSSLFHKITGQELHLERLQVTGNQ
jgi:hypothetical protein